MNILDLEQVLEYELKLLVESGATLSNFCAYEGSKEPLFPPPPLPLKSYLHKQYHLNPSTMKTHATHPNAVLNVFSCVILTIFYESQFNFEMAQYLKCILYSPSLQINQIQNQPKRNLANNVMKKLLAEFFQVLHYNKTPV